MNHDVVYFQQNKKEAKTEGKECHAKTCQTVEDWLSDDCKPFWNAYRTTASDREGLRKKSKRRNEDWWRHDNSMGQKLWGYNYVKSRTVDVASMDFCFPFFWVSDFSFWFFPSFLVREDPNLCRCVLLYVSGRCREYSSTLWGWSGLHLSSSKSYLLWTIDNPILVINSWLIRGLDYQ
jgi:hypothetical protein